MISSYFNLYTHSQALHIGIHITCVDLAVTYYTYTCGFDSFVSLCHV